MLRKLSSTFRIGLAAMFAVLSSGLMPAYASANNGQGQGGNNGNNAQLQQVFCNIQGNSDKVRAQIGGPNTSHEQPLQDANGEPIFVQSQSEVTEQMQLDCEAQYPGPQEPTEVFVRVTFICYASKNGLITQTGANVEAGDYVFRIKNESNYPTSYTANVAGNPVSNGSIAAMETLFFTTKTEYKGLSVSTSPELNTYKGTASAGQSQLCTYEDTPTPLPAGIADVCGIGNDVVPDADTEYYTVTDDSDWKQDGNDVRKTVRTITYTANTGFKFSASQGWNVSEDGKTATYTYTDWGTPCTTVCKEFPLIHATNLDLSGWTLGNGAEFVDGGIQLSSTGNWENSTISRDLTGNLSELGDIIDFTPNQDYLGLHVETSKGTIVYEKFYENQDPANTGKWWSHADFSVAGGQGYATFDTLDNIIAANPGVSLEKLTVLYTSPTENHAVVTSVKIGCQEFTFDLVEDVVPTEPEEPTVPQIPVLGTVTEQPRALNQYVPEMLPQTGATGPAAQSANALWVLLAGLMTYAALYYAQPRRQTDES